MMKSVAAGGGEESVVQPGPSQPSIDELSRQVRKLEERVRVLEQRLGMAPEEWPAAEPAPQPGGIPESPLAETAKAVPVVGRALLGLAGAYLLRALTEGGVLPVDAGVAAGIFYALCWLPLAARIAAAHRAAAAVHAATSMAILMPLLWEAMLRFHALSSWTVAGILAGVCVFGLAISWRGRLSGIEAITTLACLAAAAALLTVTRDLAPFTLALLAAAAAVEFSACFERALGLRWVAALFADGAALLLVYIVTRPAGFPEGYAPVARGLQMGVLGALLGIYLASTMVRTLWRGAVFTGFEAVQWFAAFLLSLGGALQIAHYAPAAVRAVSVFSLAASAVCYVISFAFLGEGKHGRNFYMYSAFGLLLAVSGSSLLVSGTALAAVLSALALVCLWIGREAGRMTLKWHGTLYLLVAAAASGLWVWSTGRLLGAAGIREPLAPAAAIGACAAVLGYTLAFRSHRTGEWPWPRRLIVLLLAANCIWTLGGLAAEALASLSSGLGFYPALFRPTLRTAVLTGLSVAVAWTGVRSRRFELAWLVYPLMAVAAYKLVAQDFLQGQTLPLFAALFLYGGALVFLPRILQKPRRG